MVAFPLPFCVSDSVASSRHQGWPEGERTPAWVVKHHHLLRAGEVHVGVGQTDGLLAQADAQAEFRVTIWALPQPFLATKSVDKKLLAHFLKVLNAWTYI